MATRRWLGTAAPVVQISTVQVTAFDAATTYILTINGKTIRAVGVTSTTATAAAIVTAWNASTIPEFAEVTASSSTDTVTLTADTAGKPFVATSSVSGGGGTIGAVTTTTAATGPNFWDATTNWSTSTVPVAADDVVFDQGSIDVKYGMAQSAVTLTSFTRTMGYTGKIGLPEVNADSTSTYYDYRATFLAISATTVTLSDTAGTGGGRFKLDTGSVQTTIIVRNTGSRTETDVPSFVWKGTHASNSLTIQKGDVGVAIYGGEVATLLTLNVGYVTSQNSDSKLYLGAGVTLTAPTVTITGGTVEFNSAITGASTVTILGGTVTYNGTGGIATGLAVRGGTLNYNTTGTLGGAPLVSGAGVLSFDNDLRTKTVTNQIEVFGTSAKVSDRNKVVTTLVLDLNEGAVSSNADIGSNVRITRGTPS